MQHINDFETKYILFSLSFKFCWYTFFKKALFFRAILGLQENWVKKAEVSCNPCPPHA